jgi:predicted cupin superfamily sugar epimerase
MKPQDQPDSPTAEELIQRLELLPHPEGGFYRETWRHNPSVDERGQGTAIYFLLPGGVTNRWHRVDATEIWHHYGGASLELRLSAAPPTADRLIRLGQNILDGELPQAIVQPHEWQSAKSLGDWTLVGCTVSPAFEFDGFELLDD